MSSSADRAARRGQNALNTFHSLQYFSPDLGEELAARGIGDPMGAYIAGRAAAFGPVGAGVVSAAFYSFRHDLVARHVPAVWERMSPREVWAARLRGADATLRRLLGPEALEARPVRDAARLALDAALAGERPGRPLYAAHADRAVPDAPHLALWYGATLLREHRGDSHIVALRAAGLGGLEALVSHCASGEGMPREVVMTKRGWTEEDWVCAEKRLCERGLMTVGGVLTPKGRRLRADVEDETDRIDRAPYLALGRAGVEELTAIVEGLVRRAGAAGAFPPGLESFFLPRDG
ncbi:SCO6745 family protein [Streptomyces sp. NPDC003444]